MPASAASLNQEQTDALVGLVDWVYLAPPRSGGRDWFADRLQFAQVLIARNLELFQSDKDRLTAFATNAAGLAPGLEQQWLSFTEGKINVYVEKLAELEREAGAAQHQYGEQSGVLVKSLSDTMLGAIAALIGSFIAAAFKDPFNAALFRIGVGVYVGYMLVFPMIFGMTNHWMRFDGIRTQFQHRLSRFTQLLGEVEVERAVGERPKLAETHFKTTFGWALGAYAIVFALALVAVFVVPGLIEGD